MAVVLSVALHVPIAALLALRAAPPIPPMLPEPPAIEVTLVDPFRAPDVSPPPGPEQAKPEPAAEAAPAAPAAAQAAPKPAPPRPVRPARRPPPANVETVVAGGAPQPAPVPVMATVGEAQLAGALTAGSGSGTGSGAGSAGGGGGGGSGGGCDMVRSLQEALRTDPDVQAAMARAHRTVAPGRAILVWDGDWVLTPGQSGKGLAGVRQAIALEVAFAPQACRAQTMRGLVLITFSDAPGAPRLVLGSSQWRWTDLLTR
nr:hypothetical protein [Brevundimonas lenta]